MSLKERIEAKLRESMRARDADATGAVRLVLAAIKNREIDKGDALTDEECVKILATLAKQRQESIDLYRQGGRDDLVRKEEAELVILREFLPQPLGKDELESLVDAAIAEAGATGPRDMGAVMKLLSPKISGRADGKVVSTLVRERLVKNA